MKKDKFVKLHLIWIKKASGKKETNQELGKNLAHPGLAPGLPTLEARVIPLGE